MIARCSHTRSVLFTAGVFVLSVSPALAQTLGQAADDGVSPWRVVLALVVGLGLAVAVPFAMKSRGGASPLFRFGAARESQLKVLECVRLGRNADLCLVECGGRRLLLAVSANGTIQPVEFEARKTGEPENTA